jgi:RNA polymerase sigma factor (sigma-70 family)
VEVLRLVRTSDKTLFAIIMPRERLRSVLCHLRKAFPAPHLAALSDAELLDRFAEGEAAALGALIWRHSALVWGVCRRVLRHQQSAEDAFQATFLLLVRHASSIRVRAAVGNWLYKVAYRTALAARTREHRRRGHETCLIDLAEPEITPAIERQEMRRVLDEEIQRLPEKYRRPLLLCYLSGYTTAQAAHLLSCPRGTVLTRLAWARQRLRMRLQQRGVAWSAGSLAGLLMHEAARAVPVPLVLGAVRSAIGSQVPMGVASLAQGVMINMLFSKLRTVVLLVLALGITGGTGWIAYPPRATDGKVSAASESGNTSEVPQLVKRPGNPPTPEQLIAHLNEQPRRLKTLMADVSIRAQQGSKSIGLIGELAFMKPRRLRCVARVGGSFVSELGCNDDGFWVWNRTNDMSNRAYFRSYADVATGHEADTLIVPHQHGSLFFSRQWILDVLGMTEYDPSRWTAVTLWNSTRNRAELRRQIVLPGGGEEGVQLVRFAQTATGLQVQGHEIQDRHGYRLFTASIADWHEDRASGVRVPCTLHIEWPDESVFLTVKLDGIRVNEEIDAERQRVLFTPPRERTKTEPKKPSADYISIILSPDRLEAGWGDESLIVQNHKDMSVPRKLLRIQLEEWIKTAGIKPAKIHLVVRPDVHYQMVRSVLETLKQADAGIKVEVDP